MITNAIVASTMVPTIKGGLSTNLMFQPRVLLHAEEPGGEGKPNEGDAKQCMRENGGIERGAKQ